MLNAGIFDMQQYVNGGWVTALRYEDEVNDDLKKRTGGKKDKLRAVSTCVIPLIGFAPFYPPMCLLHLIFLPLELVPCFKRL